MELVERMFAVLNENDIVYCHWKSNYSLRQTLSGELDVDLLVDRTSLLAATRFLCQLGFKSAAIRWGAEIPGIYHFYGIDSQTGRLIHVHLFSQVLTGESFVKSHLFPFEKMFFENVDWHDQIRLTSKSAELVLFTLRMFIKYGSPLDIVYLTRGLDQLRQEAQWLCQEADFAQTLELIQEYCPVMDEQLFTRCVAALCQETSLLKRIWLAWQVRRRLRVYQKYTFSQRLLAYIQLIGAQVRRRLDGNRKNKTLRNGGTIIAFVGPEATGKSTLVTESTDWLAGEFAVDTVHAGKPPSSWLTMPMNLLIKRQRKRTASKLRVFDESVSCEGDREFYMTTRKDLVNSSLLYALRSLGLAWDRKQLLLKVRQRAANGEIIICDRYPSNEVGAMDSRRLHRQPGGLRFALYNWLAGIEEKLYKQIPPPDMVLRLKVSIETAKQRNRDRIKSDKEGDAYLEARHRQCKTWYIPGTKYIRDVDTERPLDETILDVKKIIWDVL